MTPPAMDPIIDFRPIEPGDRAALIDFYAALSEDSRHERFHGASLGIGEGAAGSFCGPDHEHREGLVAVLPGGDGQGSSIVGHLCLEPSGSEELEMAVAVADDRRRTGIGRRLLLAAMAWAARHGIVRLRASMLVSNPAILALVRSIGRPVTLTASSRGVLDAWIDVSADLPRFA